MRERGVSLKRSWQSVARRAPANVLLAVLVLVVAACGGATVTRTARQGPIIATRLASELALYRINPRNGHAVRLSPGHDARDSQPACGPDGHTVAFIRETVRGVELRLLDLRTGRSRLLRRLDDASVDPAWSPAGSSLLAYTESVNGLRVLAVRTGKVTVLSRGYDEHASWSPDGKRLAFAHDRTGNGDTSIWTMNADGSARRRLTHSDEDKAPAWSPNGSRIAFERRYDVWLVNADGSNERRVISDARGPTWAHDGTLLVTEYRPGSSGLYALTPGRRPRRIVSGVWPEACWEPR